MPHPLHPLLSSIHSAQLALTLRQQVGSFEGSSAAPFRGRDVPSPGWGAMAALPAWESRLVTLANTLHSTTSQAQQGRTLKRVRDLIYAESRCYLVQLISCQGRLRAGRAADNSKDERKQHAVSAQLAWAVDYPDHMGVEDFTYDLDRFAAT